MAETTKLASYDSQMWLWDDMMSDLERQGGLIGVVIEEPFYEDGGYNGSCNGQTKEGTMFYISWSFNWYLLVSMSREEPALIEAFARVVEYRPFCRYINEDGLLTFEWNKQDPEECFAELQEEEVKELQRV